MKKERKKQMLIKHQIVQSSFQSGHGNGVVSKNSHINFSLSRFLDKNRFLGIICEIMVNMVYHNMNLGYHNMSIGYLKMNLEHRKMMSGNS